MSVFVLMLFILMPDGEVKIFKTQDTYEKSYHCLSEAKKMIDSKVLDNTIVAFRCEKVK